MKKCALILLAVFMLLPPAPAMIGAQDGYSVAHAMRVDYNPETNELAGLCRVNGHPCWLLLDTGWCGVTLYADRATAVGANTRVTRAAHTGDQYASVRLRLNLEAKVQPEFRVPALILTSLEHHRTSTGQPISGLLGVPFLNLLPVEWNVPAHKIVFWMRGRPRRFRHVPHGAVIQCTHDQDHRLLVPVSVHGRWSQAYLDTGADELYLFDSLISDFPAAGAQGTFSGPFLHFDFIPRDVKGLKIGPLTINGTVGGRLPGRPTEKTPFPFGLLGMPLVARLHLFIIGNRIIFDPRLNGTHPSFH